MLGQEFDGLRPDDYYVRVVRYNEIIERINDRGEKHDLQYFHPVRTIYSNIKALKIDFVRALVIDWRTCPDGSIIVIDEVQLVPPYNDNKNKAHDLVQELTIHRHRGFDFWFITQSPSYLHPTIKELISCHLHITRPYWRTPKVYQYGSLRQYPNTLINKLNCESKFTFKPKDFIFKLYKSTTIDTSKKRTPAGLYAFAAFIFFAICIFLYGLSGGSGFFCHFMNSCEVKTNASKNSASSAVSTSSASNSSSDASKGNQAPMDLSIECRKGENVEKPECVEWFNSKQATGASLSVSYNPDKPFDTELHGQYAVTSQPVFSGCIKYAGRYYAYTQQGTRLNVSSSDCKRLIEDGDRPFNYFQQPKSENHNFQEQKATTNDVISSK
nr:zonular occludens toxin domain-containing protein [Acinetobacter junii]